MSRLLILLSVIQILSLPLHASVLSFPLSAGEPDLKAEVGGQANWVFVSGKSYCATPDHNILMRAEVFTTGDVYLYVRSGSSAEIQYYLITETSEAHLYRRLDRNAVNFPFYIESTQLFSDKDTLTFKDRGERILKTYPMRFSYHAEKSQACQ